MGVRKPNYLLEYEHNSPPAGGGPPIPQTQAAHDAAARARALGEEIAWALGVADRVDPDINARVKLTH